MSDNEFLKGVKLETKKGQYGEYIKGSINVETIFENPVSSEKWINFMIFKSKSGNWYAVQSKPQNKVIDEDEIPF